MSAEQAHVSIIIPAKNEERDLRKCLTSLHNLEYPADRIDITLVDNGSTDRTREIAAEYGINIVRNDTATIAGLRNIGAAATEGEILGFLDADMEVDPLWLATAVEALRDDRVGAAGGSLGICQTPTWVERTWTENKISRPDRCEVRWLGSGNFLMRRSVFDEVGGWNEALVTCEDLDICEKIKQEYVLLYDTRIHVIHHGTTKTLSELFRKELWRGKNNFQRDLSRTNLMQDLPSLALPVIHGAFLLAVLFALVFAPHWLAPALGLALLVPFLRSAFVTLKTKHWLQFPRHIIIWFVYYTARSIAPWQPR